MDGWAIINRGIGHWPPSEMENMSLDDYYHWFEIAANNIEAKNKAIEEANNAQ